MSRKTGQVKAVFWTAYKWASYREKTNDLELTFYRDEDDPERISPQIKHAENISLYDTALLQPRYDPSSVHRSEKTNETNENRARVEETIPNNFS